MALLKTQLNAIKRMSLTAATAAREFPAQNLGVVGGQTTLNPFFTEYNFRPMHLRCEYTKVPYCIILSPKNITYN